MELGLNLAMTNWDTGAEPNLSLARLAEKLGFNSVWTEEAYGSDAVSPLAWVGARTERIGIGSAVWQIPARTPAMAAMTAATLDKLSGGRFRLGLGVSGPQVVEGWHGQEYGHPLARTREYVEVVRRILARREPVAFSGEHYRLPYEGGTGLGKPLKLILHPLRDRIPIYVGALGPRNVELTAEIADGWLPIFFAPSRYEDVFAENLERGFAAAGGGKRVGLGFDLAPIVSVVVGDDVDECRAPVKRRIALYIGGMGAAGGRNFSNNLIRRFGYAEVADEVQARFLAGEIERAVAAIPDELIDEVALCGPRERIAELLHDWERSPVTTIICDTADEQAMTTIAELVLRDAGANVSASA
ncbi:MAG TPA: LLM class F420-dependent oxidoreductase [Solirubrobacteraceae bacterium]|jgi:F420-dependent oxidoreductase-like protein|nr:LLM class F420-dependent oxidoreductase [Solirubrobacteraceae bacterium]